MAYRVCMLCLEIYFDIIAYAWWHGREEYSSNCFYNDPPVCNTSDECGTGCMDKCCKGSHLCILLFVGIIILFTVY